MPVSSSLWNRTSEYISPVRFQFPFPCIILALMLLSVSGCIQPQGGTEPSQPPVPDYSYDLLVKDVSTLPQNVYIGDNYTVMVHVQRYGMYSPSAYRLRVFDSDRALFDGIVSKPGLMETFSFNYTDADGAPHNIRAYVESADILHSEPPLSLENNFLQRTVHPQPLGYYSACYSCMHLYYDAVSYAMRQAQAINMTRGFIIHRVGLYLRAAANASSDAPVIIEICRDNGNKPGEAIASSSIDGAEVGQDAAWHYAQFQNLTLPAGRYWITARLDTTDSYGVQWARSEGNPYGEEYDTMAMDLTDWPEWDYKLFDFVFQVY